MNENSSVTRSGGDVIGASFSYGGLRGPGFGGQLLDDGAQGIIGSPGVREGGLEAAEHVIDFDALLAGAVKEQRILSLSSV
jgi:hypothetical protein